MMQRLFDRIAKNVCVSFAVAFVSVFGAAAAAPGILLVWATVPYENPSLFHKEVVVSLILVTIAALIHWNIYGLGRLWGWRCEWKPLRVLNDHLRGGGIPADIPTPTLSEILSLLERLPGMTSRMAAILSAPVVAVMVAVNYVHLGSPLYALYVLRGALVAMITYIMFTYLITEIITYHLRREARFVLAERDALQEKSYSSSLLIKFVFIIILMMASILITHGLGRSSITHSALASFAIFAVMNVTVGVFMCVLIFMSILITLREIESAALHMNDQKGARFMTGSIDREFLNMSTGLYQAARKIARFQNDLKELNLTLEKKVEERTEQIKILSMTDSLTGCFNRAYFMERLPQEIKRAIRYGNAFSIVICDLDHFKKVNDAYGHPGGDQALKEFVLCVKGAFRQDMDWVARYGGEEFVIVLPETNIEGACALAERIRMAIANRVIPYGGREIRITSSFGITGFDAGASAEKISEEDIIRKADQCLYRAKEGGRNRVVAEGIIR